MLGARRGEARQGLVRQHVRAGGAGGPDARSGALAFVRLSRRRSLVPEGVDDRPAVRDLRLGHRFGADREHLRGRTEPAAGAGGEGRHRPRARHCAQERSREELHRSDRRVLREPSSEAAHATHEGALRCVRGADLLRGLPHHDAAADRQDLCFGAEGGGDPGGAIQEAPGSSGRRALSHPQLRLSGHRGERDARRARILGHRAVGAARAAHAVAYLYARRRVEGLGGDQRALGERGEADQGAA